MLTQIRSRDYVLARGVAIYVSGVVLNSESFMTSGDYQQVLAIKLSLTGSMVMRALLVVVDSIPCTA